MRRFIDDDAGYLRWLAANPDGYVVNAARTQTSGPLMLHHAGCRTITGVPSRGTRWTGPYIKLCGNRDELESAVRGEFGVTPTGCGLCLRHEPRPAAPAAISRPRTGPRDAGPAARPTSPPVTPVAEWPPRFLRPVGEPIRLPLTPRLASWNRAGDPDQLRLEQFLAATAELVMPRIEKLPDPLALRLDVGLPRSVRLLDAHDLDNYLYPLASRLTKLTGRQFATVWGTKAHRADSLIRVDTAIADITSGSFALARLLAVDAAAQTVEFKEQVRDQLLDAEALPDGPISLHIGFVVGQSHNWANLWKPTIDSLDPILGRTRAQQDWHPRDGRIVELALHRHNRPGIGRHVTVALGANRCPDEN